MKRYIIFTPYYISTGEFYFVSEGQELNKLLSYLDDQRIHKDVNQSLLSIYKIIEEDKKYPTTIYDLVKVMNERQVNSESENFVIRWLDSSLGEYRLEGNKSRGGIEEKLVELVAAGEKEILILNADEAKDAEAFYQEYRNKKMIGSDQEESIEKTIIFVTAFKRLAKAEGGECDFGSKFIIGLSDNIDTARGILKSKESFVRDHFYEFIIIEEIFMGVHPFAKKTSETYKVVDPALINEGNTSKKNAFEKINTPVDLNNIIVGISN